jgi:HEAT repeat protein
MVRFCPPLFALIALQASWAAQAAADPSSPKGAPGGHASSAMTIPLPADAMTRLKSGNPEGIESALGDVRVSGRAGLAAAPAIVELLRHGLPQALTQAALDTLGDVESEAASETISWYARDRDPVVRRSSVSALAKTKGGVASKTLRAALSDSDPGVRGLAATGLGLLRAKDAVGDLFRALDHNVPEAAASIGALCSAPDCEKLGKKLESLPFDVITSGLSEVLLRPAVEVDDETKIAILGRLRALATSEAGRFLREVQSRYPAHGSERVKRALNEAVAGSPAPPAESSEPAQ